jgi:hypothetical protein
MKPHESKKQGQNKSEIRRKTKCDKKNQIEKGEKAIKRQVKKAKKGRIFFLQKVNKRERTKDQCFGT